MKEIRLFNRALEVQNRDFSDINSMAIQKGYAVVPECCNDRVLSYIATLPHNINTTFYKSWEDVTTKSRMELLLDQLVHYSSTYGTNHKGPVYVPNDSPEQINFTDCKVILPISKLEIQTKIQSMFDSGIALKQETIDDCIGLIDELSLDITIATIKNKEVKIIICDRLNLLPDSPEEMVRLLVYKATGSSLIINSSEVLATIQHSGLNITPFVTGFGIEKLSQVFYRYKKIFLAFRKAGLSNKYIVNRLRRKAKTNHIPKPKSFWENILNDVNLLPQLEGKLKNVNNFMKVRLLQAILVRKANTGIMPVRVRNGKLFITTKSNVNKAHLTIVYDLIYKSLIESLSKKACLVKLPDSLNLTVPSSEKSFIGNIPFGSFIDTDTDTIAGINWRSVDGANDLDLSLLTIDGQKIGWNSSYFDGDKSLVYSGDMTSANPEATELFYFKQGAMDSIVKTNLYSGKANSEYTFFIGKVKDYNSERGRMIDPNDVVFSTRLKMSQSEMTNGAFVNDKFIFLDLSTGNARVSSNNPLMLSYMDHLKKTSNCFLELDEVLVKAGFGFAFGDDADLDLSTLDKSDLIELFS
jgi:hypothetical protein